MNQSVLNFADIFVLIYKYPGVYRQAELAELTGMDKGKISRLVQAGKKKSLIDTDQQGRLTRGELFLTGEING